MPHSGESQLAITLYIALWNKRTQPELNYFVKFANQLDLRLDEEGWATLRATSEPHTHKKARADHATLSTFIKNEPRLNSVPWTRLGVDQQN